MSGFFWNIRGLNKSNKQQVIKEWVSKHGFQFGCILETRVEDTKAIHVAKKVFSDWNLLTNYEFNRRGRIWIVWKKTVNLTVVFKSAQMITCLLKIPGIDEEICCSFIYASNFAEERRELWRDINNHQDNASFNGKAWIIFGDFNETLALAEHSNIDTSPSLTSGMRDFQNVVRHCSLTNMLTHGPHFTWCNKREEGLIYKRLDRVLQNPSWLQSFPTSYCLMESGGCSDHLRGRFYLRSDLQKPKGPFKFTNAIALQPEFLPKLEAYWRETTPLYHSTSALFRLSKKLKLLKPMLRELSREKLANISRREAEAYEDLCAKQLLSFSNTSTEALADESLAFNRWEKVSDLEERFLKQKSKLHWLQVGDRNNKYFHNSVKERQTNNAIYEILNPQGISLTSTADIKGEATRFFSELLNHQPDDFLGCSVERLQELLPFRCSVQQQELLTATVSSTEVKSTLFAMPSNKSPGPDGFTVEFFKSSWSIVGADFTCAVQSFFQYGFLPKGINSTILTLIPKRTDAKEMKDYRPISCCNVLYKTISKIVANRFKKILPDFIAPNQSAFIKDRLLMENLLLATELVKDYHKEAISPRCAMKIDISKAFDSVQWPFLQNLLSALHLPEQFIHWIKLCVTTASFSTQVNGELSGYFNSRRGLRQGCSLSPYLFVTCMNVLSTMLDKSAENRVIPYHPGCKNLKITHLCFADDIIVFSDGTLRSIEGILNIFTEFAAISGLRISLEKTTIFLAGQSATLRAAITARFPFEYGSLPVRYLGLPLLTKRMSLSDCMPLIEKIRMRISSWKHRFLSYGGRLQLLQSVIASLTNFWIAAFRLPRACVTEIEKICSAFLWSGPDLNPRKAKIRWSDVCKPKQEGGLGLKSIVEVNKVCCYKLIWRIVSRKNSLWVNWIHRELIRSASFWSVKENRTSGSWMWQKLLKYRQEAKTYYKMEIRSGQETSFWYDNWSSMGPLHDILGDRGFIDLGISAEASVATAQTTRRRRRHRVTILNQVETELNTLSIPSPLNEDVALWRNADGRYKPNFSTPATWAQVRQQGNLNNWHKAVWFSGSTPKYSFILWLSIHNRLSTGDRMLNWNSGVAASCVFCQEPLESRDHLFFSCSFGSHVWVTLTRKLLGHRFTTSFSTILDLLNDGNFTTTKKFLLRYVLQASVYTLWQERNNRRHGAAPLPLDHHIKSIDRLLRNRIMSYRRLYPNKLRDAYCEWIGSHS